MYAGESVSVKGQPQVGISSPRNFFPLVHFFCHPFIPTVASRASLSFTSILPVPIHTHTHTHTTQGLGCLPSSFFFYNFCVYTFSTSCEFRFFAAIGRHKIHLHSLSISPALSFALRLLTCQGLSVTLRIIRPAALDSCSAFLALTPSFLTYTCYTELYNTTTHNTT